MKNASLEKIVHRTEAEAIQDALLRHNYKLLAVSQELGIARVTLWRKMKLFKLRRRRMVSLATNGKAKTDGKSAGG